MRTARLMFGLLLLAGCSDGTEPSSPGIYSITPATQWSGGTVRIASTALNSGGTAPSFEAGGAAVSATRLNDTTFEVTLPVLPSGPVTIRRAGRSGDLVGVVQVVGLRLSRLVAGDLGYEPLVPEGQAGVVFVAQGAFTGDTALSILDPETDQVSTVRGLWPVEESFGVQPDYLNNQFVLREPGGRLGVWRLFPAALRLDSAAVQTTSARHVTQLNDSTWLSTFSNVLLTTFPSGYSTSGSGLVSDPLRVVFSPDRHRVALVMASAPMSRAPVLDAATGDTAYTVHAQSPTGAAFSPHADRLFIAANIQYSDDSLLAVRASDGLRLAGVALPAGYDGFGLAVDPKVDRVYQVADSSGTRALLIYDGASLALLGRATCSGDCGNIYSWSAGIGVDTLSNKIHVAFPGSPIPVITYDRLP